MEKFIKYIKTIHGELSNKVNISSIFFKKKQTILVHLLMHGIIKFGQQKVVIRLSINGHDKKSRSKAFKIAVSQPGMYNTCHKFIS